MVYTLLSWLGIGVSAFLWGFVFLFALNKINQYNNNTLDLIIIVGLCLLTIYAQIFSLFGAVNQIALLGVFLLDIIWLFFIHTELLNWIRKLKKSILSYQLLLITTIGLFVLIASSGSVQAYDTSLYHAQAIHWIEEYGVIPGLGNLHTRLAYNSSFLCLQALFSFRFLAGQSLHSVNGFIMWVMLSYAICSTKFLKKKEICISDFCRLTLLIYYAEQTKYSSSPTTDMFSVGLVIYIICKWITLVEEAEAKIAPYAYLCILGVYAITLKLSVAMIIFLVIMPAYQLIKEKNRKEIILYISLGILTFAPFLIRNILLSGYLLYPYPELDLFSVDWKIPSSKAFNEQSVIKAWAQGFRGSYTTETTFSEWFPIWKSTTLSTSPKEYILFLINLLSMPILLIIETIRSFRKKKWQYLHITCCLIIGFLFWFFSAPTPRFGRSYELLIPFYLTGIILKNYNFKILTSIVSISVLVTMGYYCITKTIAIADWSYSILPADYGLYNCTLTKFGDLQIYSPESEQDDRTGYYAFPSTPYIKNLENIELRGKTFADGFRPKLTE